MNLSHMWGVLVLAVAVLGKVSVVELTSETYVSRVGGEDGVAWLVLFRGSRVADQELLQGVKNVAKMIESEQQLHIGVVNCDDGTHFCRDAFGMDTTPWLVLYHQGVWSVGTTWVYTLPPTEWQASDERNIAYIRDFALFNYKLKVRETQPWRLRYDPNDPLSRYLWMVLRPSFNFAQIGELMSLRKNAVVAMVSLGVAVGFAAQRILWRLLGR